MNAGSSGDSRLPVASRTATAAVYLLIVAAP